MTKEQQLSSFEKVSYLTGIKDIETLGRKLTEKELRQHLKAAIETGLVAHVLMLMKLCGQTMLTRSQTHRIVTICVKRKWVPDAISATRHGVTSKALRLQLIAVLVRHKYVKDKAEALEVLAEPIEK